MANKAEQYQIVEKAINFIIANRDAQPSLEDIAEAVNLSSFHFQRVFSEWAGISPKQFLQALTIRHAKALLKSNSYNLFDVAHESGLSGTSRLHDLFIKIEAMSPAEYKNGAKGLQIHYHYYESKFGKALIANTPRGICYLAFEDNANSKRDELMHLFANASFVENRTALQEQALQVIDGNAANGSNLKLHIKGSAFQLKVWGALLQIPEGKLESYGSLASQLQMPKSARAVGTAIGSNLVAYLIPCHRVIQQSGALGGYRWGLNRKAALLASESNCRNNFQNHGMQ